MTRMRGLLLGGMMLAGAMAASAADQTRATIGFDFRTPSGLLPAGAYEVNVNSGASGNKFIQLRNVATLKSVMFYTETTVNKTNPTAKPEIRFECGNTGCSLSELWTDGRNGYTVRKPKADPADTERLAITVPLNSVPPAE